ncbi:MAG: hypothetical protein Q7V58_16740 [Actinomycetota bacterium]|nr:hypothetical protein [Actinomycetota bacterium]
MAAGSSEGASDDAASDGAADSDGGALLSAALDSEVVLLELHPASAIAETAMTAAAIFRLVFNVSPY